MRPRFLAFAVILLTVAGCGSAHHAPGAPHSGQHRIHGPAPTVSRGAASTLVAGNDVFAGRLLDLLGRRQATVALAPFSISDALAMTSAGARASTATQIATALHFGLSSARLPAAFGALQKALAGAGGRSATLTIANALYAQRGTPIRKAFLNLLRDDYATGIRTADFEHGADAARMTINAWVAAQTHGRIADLLGPADVDALTRLLLVNAVYLNAKWESTFQASDTSRAAFHSPGGTVDVPTMHQTAMFAYRRGSGYDAVELPYRGGRLALDVLLPRAGGLSSLEHRLANGGLAPALRGLKPVRIQLALPKLLLNTHVELAPALSSLGMPLAFSDRADLSGIAGPPGALRLSAVVHAVYLRVDEAGTEAAAATGVGVVITAEAAGPTVVFDVNRPFVFVLRDRATGAVVFLGAVSHP